MSEKYTAPDLLQRFLTVTTPARMLGWWVVTVLVLVGAANIAVVLFPLRFGDANWEVAAFGELASSFAVPTLGATLLGFLATQRGAMGRLLLGAVWCAILGSIVTLGGLILALDIPVGSILTEPAFGSFSPGVRSPAVADGYWIALNPLAPGFHTLHLRGRVSGGVFETEVFYDIVVQ